MGKSEKSGTVWLSPEKTSPYEFYQYWINIADADVAKCLALFTDLSHEELDALDARRVADPGKRESQLRLAEELTRLVHEDGGLEEARRATKALFSTPVDRLGAADLAEAVKGMPGKEVSQSLLDGPGLNIIDALITVGLSKSKSEARRSIEQGGVKVNDARVNDFAAQLTRDNLIGESSIILGIGKNKKAVLRFV
jgi:tyrosyl-tRNA synthetase